MRAKSDIIRDLNAAQTACDRLINDIGLGYTQYALTSDKGIAGGLMMVVNHKIEAYKKAARSCAGWKRSWQPQKHKKSAETAFAC